MVSVKETYWKHCKTKQLLKIIGFILLGLAVGFVIFVINARAEFKANNGKIHNRQHEFDNYGTHNRLE